MFHTSIIYIQVEPYFICMKEAQQLTNNPYMYTAKNMYIKDKLVDNKNMLVRKIEVTHSKIKMFIERLAHCKIIRIFLLYYLL